MVHLPRVVFILMGLSMFNIGCQSQPPVNQTSEKEELLKTDRTFSDYSTKHTAAEAFARYLTDDALQLPSGADPVRGRDSIVAGMNRGMQGILSWSPQEAEISQSGDLGYTWGTYTYEYERADGTTGISHGKYLNVWKKQPDGAWKVEMDMGNQSPAPTAGK